jgi:AcrR family transcriptional regulator
MKQGQDIEKNPSTEEKIKEAARRVFTRKGYAATRTRDIAEESGYNLALINYYFRSKEKLFDLIMLENLQTFAHSVQSILNDPATSLDQKLEILVSHYIDMLITNPGLPLFILNEINADPTKLMTKVGIKDLGQKQLYVALQWQELAAQKKQPLINPLHIMMNVVAMTIFPFAGSPLIRHKFGLSTDEFNALMEERKKLIPVWIRAIIGISMAENKK